MMYDQKLYYRYLISLGIVIFVFIFYLKGGKFDPSILLTASSAAGITIILDKFIFKTILWKLCPDLFYSCKITNIPFLGGCWEGTLESNYMAPGRLLNSHQYQQKLKYAMNLIVYILKWKQISLIVVVT